MYTNTIIGSYNAIANSEHHAMIMKPPIKKQPRKANSKEGHQPHQHHTSRGNSEEAPVNNLNNIVPPQAHPQITPADILAVQAAYGQLLPGLEILASVTSVLVNPDKLFSPEVSKIGFSVDLEGGEEPKSLFRCLPAETSNSRSLHFQTLEGRTVLQLQTETPYCCSWYKNLEAKICLPNGDSFGSVKKTAFGPLKCNRRFQMTCQKGNGSSSADEKIQFDIEVVFSPSEFIIKERDEVVAKVTTSRGTGCRTAYKVTFLKPTELSPNIKAMFILFAVILHIAFAEKLNTCFGMGLCCFAASSVASWILCVL